MGFPLPLSPTSSHSSVSWSHRIPSKLHPSPFHVVTLAIILPDRPLSQAFIWLVPSYPAHLNFNVNSQISSLNVLSKEIFHLFLLVFTTLHFLLKSHNQSLRVSSLFKYVVICFYLWSTSSRKRGVLCLFYKQRIPGI